MFEVVFCDFGIDFIECIVVVIDLGFFLDVLVCEVGYCVFNVDLNVGGCYLVFMVFGLVFLGFVGVDIDELLNEVEVLLFEVVVDFVENFVL